jgi:putative ABC transport system permease protein
MFDERDRDGAPNVAVVNARLARQLWAGDDPVGRRIEVMGEWWTVVGVAGDVAIRGLFSKPYEILLPYTQGPVGAMTLVAHTAGEPAPMLAAVRGAVRSLDTDQPITDVRTLEGLRDELSRPIAFLASVLILFGGSALLLATAGICGVVSHSVSTRTREIGIRMALGAERSRVLSQILGEGVRMTGIGVCFGAGGAFLLMRVLINRVWWFTPPGLQVLVPIAVLLAAVALAGSYIPAWRASRIDPVATLRNE